MLVENLTPFAFGTKVCSRHPPEPEMTIVARATFALGPDGALAVIEDPLERGSLTGELFDDDDRKRACIYPGDFADFKLSAEVLFKGSCVAPHGRAVSECPVQLSVGDWSKALHVVGPRKWTATGISKAEPFETMALSYANAFGGPGYDKNPIGKGYKTDELPTVELPSQLLATRLDRPAPASLAPIHPDWPQRRDKVGKEYGRTYQKKRAPFFAEDFDWRYFSAGPPDQQLEGFLRGDEPVRLVNLHPTVPVLETLLPGLRARAFVKGVDGRFREVTMSLDTLWIDTDELRLCLTWRGVDPVAEDDLDDVAALLLASEQLEQAPLPTDHYRALLDEFEKDPAGVYEGMPPELLELAERIEQAGDGEDPYPDAPDQGNPVSNAMARRLGPFMAEAQQRAKEGIDKALEQAPEDQREKLDEILEQVAQQDPDTPPVPITPKPGVLADMGLRRSMRDVLAQAAKLRETAADENISDEAREKLLAQVDELEKLPHDPALKQLDPDYTPPIEPISTDEPGPGRNLSEQDLTGRDLSGMDLSGADLQMAILTKANLAGANLTGAKLRKAVLYKTDLTDADLSGADLTRVNAASVRAGKACFRGANLDEGFFEKADLAGADLGEATGSYQAFAHAKLSGAKARGLRAAHADFTEADLSGADFEGAQLERAVFVSCRGRGASFSEANLERASFEKAQLEDAVFVGADADRSYWPAAKLERADLRYAKLSGAQFTKAAANGANLSFANLRESRLYRASLDRAELVQANLFRADLCKARLSETKFTGANLYDAKFLGAQGKDADFSEAILTLSTLERDAS